MYAVPSEHVTQLWLLLRHTVSCLSMVSFVGCIQTIFTFFTVCLKIACKMGILVEYSFSLTM